jgi:hypothetical protein
VAACRSAGSTKCMSRINVECKEIPVRLSIAKYT